MNRENGSAEYPLMMIGYWDDRPRGKWIMPAILADCPYPSQERKNLARYLEEGVSVGEELGYSHCRLSREIPDSMMGNADLTDGKWVWPEGLSVYVDYFGVRLPEEFVTHARASDFCNPRPAIESTKEVEASDCFWQDWCQKEKDLIGRVRYALTARWRTLRIRRRGVKLRV